MDFFNDDDGLGFDLFSAIKDTIKTPEVTAAFSKIQGPKGITPAMSGGPTLPTPLKNIFSAIGVFGKTVAAKASAQKSEPPAPATNPATGENIVPSAGGSAKPPAQGVGSSVTLLAGGLLVGWGVWMLTRRRK